MHVEVSRRIAIPALASATCLGGAAIWSNKASAPRRVYKSPRAAPLPLCRTAGAVVRENDPHLGIVATRLYPDRLADWNVLLHAIRLWGAEFEYRERGESVALSTIVLDTERARRVLGRDMLAITLHGVRVRPADYARRVDGDPHPDKTVSVLAMAGVEPSRPVSVHGERLTVARMVDSVVAECVLDQELEFSVISLAHYLPPQTCWVNKHGEALDFDRVCGRLTSRRQGEGACFGLHRLFALACVIGADSRSPILSSPTRSRLDTVLRDATILLLRNQRSDGSWDESWTGVGSDSNGISKQSSAVTRLQATGHVLEYLAVLPPAWRPDVAAVKRAVEYVLTELASLGAGEISRWFPPISHAANGVRLWSGGEWSRAVQLARSERGGALQ